MERHDHKIRLLASALYEIRLLLGSYLGSGIEVDQEIREAAHLSYALHNEADAIARGGDFDFGSAIRRVEAIETILPGSSVSKHVLSLLKAKDAPAQQAGAGQPATRPASKSEGGDKPQLDAEGGALPVAGARPLRSAKKMNRRAEIWNVLHDGGVAEIVGAVPGEVTIRVNIPYLRQMFSNDGEDIIVHLDNCTSLTMKIWNEDVTTDDPKRIASTDTEILSTESEDVPVHIITTLGELVIAFEEFSLSLDDGREISFEELCTACENYWNRWENEAKKQNKSAHPTAGNDPV